MIEQLKMTVETFGQQLQQMMITVQWLASRLGSGEELANQLPDTIHLPVTSLDELQTLESLMESSDTRSTVVCMFKVALLFMYAVLEYQ